MIVFASEDVGLADPAALQIAVAAAAALAHVGLPEATYNLSEACIYLATAPKSNSVARAIAAATEAVASTNSPRVPVHLRSSGGKGYRYPHDHPDGVVAQRYWPEGSDPLILYRPGTAGAEGLLSERQREADRILGKEER
jgi:putative ATPase